MCLVYIYIVATTTVPYTQSILKLAGVASAYFEALLLGCHGTMVKTAEYPNLLILKKPYSNRFYFIHQIIVVFTCKLV